MPYRKIDRPASDVSYALYYLLTISTKKREPLITAAVETVLRQHWPQKCQEIEVHLLALGILIEHVHFLLSLRPTHHIPDVVHDLKGSASFVVNHAEGLKTCLYWSNGYDIRTVGEQGLDAVRQYIQSQHERHPDRVPR